MMTLLEESRSYGSDGSNIRDVITPYGGKQWGITRCMTPHPTLLPTWKDYPATGVNEACCNIGLNIFH